MGPTSITLVEEKCALLHPKDQNHLLSSTRKESSCNGNETRPTWIWETVSQSKICYISQFYTEIIFIFFLTFFPFPDCVEIANNEGIKAVIQPGGSIKDNLSIDYCDANKMKMVFTGIRHFKH